VPRAIDAAAPQHAGQHRLAGEHVQRQVAVMVVVGAELPLVLMPVQRYARGIDVQHQFLGCLIAVRGDELFDQHPVQPTTSARRARLSMRHSVGLLPSAGHGQGNSGRPGTGRRMRLEAGAAGAARNAAARFPRPARPALLDSHPLVASSAATQALSVQLQEGLRQAGGRLATAQVEDYDRPFFPARRSAFLQAWLHAPGHHALGLLRDGRLLAYGVIRPCLSGYKIGPLFANRHEQAQILLQALMARVPAASGVFLDVPETNAVDVARRHGMEPMFETARMYKGASTLPDMQRTFGITTFELG